MKLRLLLVGALLSSQAFAQVDLINKVKDNGADAPLGYEWETIVDIEAPLKIKVLQAHVGPTPPPRSLRAK